jgi:hypothetical protein
MHVQAYALALPVTLKPYDMTRDKQPHLSVPAYA